MPRERWDADALYSTEAEPGKSYARFGAFLQAGASRNPNRACCQNREHKSLRDACVTRITEAME